MARDVHDPEKDMCVLERARLRRIAEAQTEQKNEVRDEADLPIGAMGDGSDYSAFIHHLGIPPRTWVSAEKMTAASITPFTTISSGTRISAILISNMGGLIGLMGSAVMRLADADLLPFDFSGFSHTIAKYVDNVQEILKNDQENFRERNREIEDGVYSATSDPLNPVLPPPVEVIPPHFNFAPLQNAVDQLSASADRLSKAWGKAQADGWRVSPEIIAHINVLIIESGPALTDSAGLPNRPWFKNMIYAPGAYTGYEAKPLPGVLEALDRKDWAEAESQIPREAEALQREKKIIDEITATLEGGAGAGVPAAGR